MEKTKYSALELFIAFGEFFCISELNISDINENFKVMKNNEKYGDLLSKYNFVESEFSFELQEEINQYIQTDKILLVNNEESIFFNMRSDQKEEINSNTSKETKNLTTRFISDFIALNMKKNCNNMKTLKLNHKVGQKVM